MFSRPPTFSLKALTDNAQTGVSKLGMVLMITFLPAKLPRFASLRSPPTSVKSGAAAPTAGRSPHVLQAFPLRVISATIVFLKFCVRDTVQCKFSFIKTETEIAFLLTELFLVFV